jgi:hypothetical protein
LNYDSKELKGVFNEDRTAITKDAYRRFYLEITRLQYGGKSEEELRKEFPAVNQFLTVLDSNPKQWVPLRQDEIRLKQTADLTLSIQ